jgi:hypothetical protein
MAKAAPRTSLSATDGNLGEVGQSNAGCSVRIWVTNAQNITNVASGGALLGATIARCR